MRKLLLTPIFLLLLNPHVWSQGSRPGGQQSPQTIVSVTGLVLDQMDQTPLPGAHISLIHQRDTSRVFRGVTDNRGRFELDVPRGAYLLKASFLGYKTTEVSIRASQETHDVGRILLPLTEAMLREVVISGQTPTSQQKGDTLQFNALAFKTNPDASAEELIRKMPGITVDAEGVKAQGEEVRRVLIDGREFFGDDPAIALRNLPAEMIEQIQVYDRMSDQAQLTGFDDGQTIKTINIVTRLDRRNGQFGKVYSGYGDDKRYQAGINTNIFWGQRRISILGMSNNINQQNFSSEDLSGFMGSSRGGSSARMGGGGGRGGSRPPQAGGNINRGDFIVGQQAGSNTTHALGLNYTDIWKNKININSSYFFNYSSNNTQSLSDRQYIANESISQLLADSSISDRTNQNHRFNARMEYKINDNHTLIFTPRFSIQDTRSGSFSNIRNFETDLSPINSSLTDYNRDWDGYSFSSGLNYRVRLNERGRSLSSSFNANINNNDYLYFLDATSYFYQGNLMQSDTLDQFSDSQTRSRSLSSNLSFTEPLGSRSMLQLSYSLSHSNNNSNRMTNSWDIVSQAYTLFENDLSSELTNGYLTQRAGASYRLRNEKINLQLELQVQQAELTADQVTPYVTNLDKTFINYLPMGSLTYNFSRTQNLRLQYRTFTNAPSVNQLQDVVDNTNPLFLSSGNPGLKESYSHFLNLRYSNANPAKSRTFMAFVFGNRSQDFIGTSTYLASQDSLLANGYILPRGAQFTQPLNMDGFVNLRSMLTYGFMFNPIKTNINFSASAGYNRTPSRINDQTNFTNTRIFSGGITLSSNISQNIDFTLSYNATQNNVNNSARPQLDNTYYYHISGVRFNWIFLKGWVLRNDVNNLFYNGLSSGFDDNYWLWNLNLGKKIMTNQQGEITLGVYDLLNQNKSVVRNISSYYIEDVRTNVLNRFFMLTFTYNIRNWTKAG